MYSDSLKASFVVLYCFMAFFTELHREYGYCCIANVAYSSDLVLFHLERLMNCWMNWWEYEQARTLLQHVLGNF